MVKKEELLKLFKEVLDAEEKSIQIYARHLESAMFWAGIDKAKAQEAKMLFKSLIEGSGSHKKIVEGLMDRIQREQKSAF